MSQRWANRTPSSRARGPSVNGDYKPWQIRTKSLDAGGAEQLERALQTTSCFRGGVKSVSGTFGHQIAVDAIYAIIVSLLLITIYIALRFDLSSRSP